jgi:hypothetical protein
MKYRQKYQTQQAPVQTAQTAVEAPPTIVKDAPRNLPKEAAADLIRSKVDNEVRRFAYANLFGGTSF